MSRVPITPPSNSTPAADRRLGQAVVLGRWGLADAGRRRVAVRLGPARRTGPPRRSRTGRSAWPRGRPRASPWQVPPCRLAHRTEEPDL